MLAQLDDSCDVEIVFAHADGNAVPIFKFLIESISVLIFQGEPSHLSLHCNAWMLWPTLACQGGALQVMYSHVIPTCISSSISSNIYIKEV